MSSVRDLVPLVLPAGWRIIPCPVQGARAFANRIMDLRVIVGVGTEGDGKRWLHVSLSHRDHVPAWNTIKMTKDLFIGKDRLALQILPPAEQYVNDHPYVMHLWSCLDGDPVPDFRNENGTI